MSRGGGSRIGGTAWIDRCDNCSREITVGHRWRKRHLCDDCAEVAVKQDIARSSMMLGNIARSRARSISRSAPNASDSQLRRTCLSPRRERDPARRFITDAETAARLPKPFCSIRRADASEAGCPGCGRYDGRHGPGCKVVAEILKVVSALKSNRHKDVLEVLSAEFPAEIIVLTLKRLAREGSR